MGGWGRGSRERVGQWGRRVWRSIWEGGRSWAIALGLVLWLGLGGCGGGAATVVPKPLLSPEAGMADRNVLAGEVAEVSPPGGIQQLKSFLDGYSPQVRIMAPRNGEVLSQTAVTARVRLQGLPIYRDAAGRLGPHLRVFLDDRPPLFLDSLTDGQGELALGDLAPGSHTLRVMATRPWGEGFKNEGALAQVTFQVFTASEQAVTPGIPQLIYNSPQGVVGAQPMLLDFWLRDIPLHEVAQGDGAIADWRLRCTINGQTFVFDRWQPIYLTGFKLGQNWIKLELIDDTGAVFPNPFNTALRVVDYQPGAADPLAALFTGEGDWQGWRTLVDPSYVPPAPVVPVEAALEETPEEEAPEQAIPEEEDSEAAIPEQTIPEQAIPEDASEAGLDLGVQPDEPGMTSAPGDPLLEAEILPPALEEPEVTAPAPLSQPISPVEPEPGLEGTALEPSSEDSLDPGLESVADPGSQEKLNPAGGGAEAAIAVEVAPADLELSPQPESPSSIEEILSGDRPEDSPPAVPAQDPDLP